MSMRMDSMLFKALFKKAYIYEYLSKNLRDAEFGDAEIYQTPLSTRIVVYVNKPSKAIGRNGENLKRMIEDLKKAGIENPTIEVKRVQDPILNPQVVANILAVQIERGLPEIRIRNLIFRFKRMMEEMGVRGIEIKIRGRHKRTANKSVKERYFWGYMRKVGWHTNQLIKEGFAISIPKLGVTSIRIRIVPPNVTFPDEIRVKEPHELDEETKKMVGIKDAEAQNKSE